MIRLQNVCLLGQVHNNAFKQLLSQYFCTSHSNVAPSTCKLSDSIGDMQVSQEGYSITEGGKSRKKVAFSRDSKVLKVAFIGRPNAGKSTLINQIIGRTVCPVSCRAHTTRLKARAVLNEDDTQVVFLDTPGLVVEKEKKKFKFEHSFLSSGDNAAGEADVIGVVYDVSNIYQEVGSLDPSTMHMLLMHKNKKSFLVLNKVDAVKKKHSLLEICRKLIGDTKTQKSVPLPPGQIDEVEASKLLKVMHSWPYFSEVFMISALEGDGVGDVKEYLLQQAHPGPWIFNKESIAHQSYEDLAINFLRAAYLDELPANIPYELRFSLLYFEEDDESCAVEIKVTPKNSRYVPMLLKCLRPVAMIAESNLSSALEKSCRLRIRIDKLKDEIRR